MRKNVLGKTGIKVTPVGMGVLTIGWTQLNRPLAEGAALITYALEQGINFFDTAEYYKTYHYLAEALKTWRGEPPVIASKSLTADRKQMERAIENCRKEIGIDVIDIFLLHELRGNINERAGAFEALLDAKAKGRVRAIGVSTHFSDVASEAAEIPEIDIIFPLINYAGLGIRKRGGAPSTASVPSGLPASVPAGLNEMEDAIEKAAKNNIGVFTMKAFGGGNLTPNYKKALDYSSKIRGAASTMIGFGKRSEVDQAIAYFEGRLPKNFVPDTKEKKMRIDPGDCEACRSCLAACPASAISINPESGVAEIDHSLCLTCGYCAPVCPVRAIIMF